MAAVGGAGAAAAAVAVIWCLLARKRRNHQRRRSEVRKERPMKSEIEPQSVEVVVEPWIDDRIQSKADTEYSHGRSFSLPARADMEFSHGRPSSYTTSQSPSPGPSSKISAEQRRNSQSGSISPTAELTALYERNNRRSDLPVFDPGSRLSMPQLDMVANLLARGVPGADISTVVRSMASHERAS